MQSFHEKGRKFLSTQNVWPLCQVHSSGYGLRFLGRDRGFRMGWETCSGLGSC